MRYFLIIFLLMTTQAEAECYSLKEAQAVIEKYNLIPLKEGLQQLTSEGSSLKRVRLCARMGRYVYEIQTAWVSAHRCDPVLTKGDFIYLVLRPCK